MLKYCGEILEIGIMIVNIFLFFIGVKLGVFEVLVKENFLVFKYFLYMYILMI